MSALSQPRRLMKRLRRSTSGLAMTEFALSLPLLFTVGLWGLETANQAMVQMEISQLAIQIADNASRVGETSNLSNSKVYEADINDVFIGANIQGGSRIDLYTNGRVIVSSLEVVPGTSDQQYIHWQRCKGLLEENSNYGFAGDGLVTEIDGMGPKGEEVYAFQGEAVIFVEIIYHYDPLINDAFTYRHDLGATAAFTVRDSRDLTQLYQRDLFFPDDVSSCNKFDNDMPEDPLSGGAGSSGWTTSTGSGSSSSSTTGGSTTTSTSSSSTTGGSTTTTTSGGSTTTTSTTTGGKPKKCGKKEKKAGLC